MAGLGHVPDTSPTPTGICSDHAPFVDVLVVGAGPAGIEAAALAAAEAGARIIACC